MRDWIETSAGPLPPSMQGVTLGAGAAGHAAARRGRYFRLSGERDRAHPATAARAPGNPLIISFGEPFAIRIGEASRPAIMGGSFVAGLVAGPALIESGAGRMHQRQLHAVRRAPVLRSADVRDRGRHGQAEDLLGNAVAALRERLGAERDWERRLDIVEAFLASRLLAMARTGTPATWAYERLWQSHGMERIEAIASQLGWSRKHLAARFRDEIGLSPKTVAQMMRFNRAGACASPDLRLGRACGPVRVCRPGASGPGFQPLLGEPDGMGKPARALGAASGPWLGPVMKRNARAGFFHQG